MAVILSNASLAVARKTHAFARDPQGQPVAATGVEPLTDFLPGSVVERADVGSEQGIEYALRLDPALWPVRVDDHVHEAAGGRVWVVTAAALKTVVGHPDVDYVSATAVLTIPTVP